MTQSTPHITDHQVIHLIGIGGCSMNGLAQVLAARGYTVRGSDSTTSPFTERLAQLGIPVTIGQAAENVEGADLVIYSAAIKADNPERVRARELGIPELERSQALGQLSQGYKTVVGVAGCHGKTTITSMLAMISQQGGLDATVHIGGFTEFLQGGTRIGSQDLFITEACEYVGSFLTLHPTIAIINNIDNDHLDYYKTIENIQAAFQQFIGLLPQDGWLFACTDDPRVRQLFAPFPGNKISYGMASADYMPADIRYDHDGCPSYDLTFRGKTLGRIVLHVQGTHQIIDSMAAAAVALHLGAAFQDIAAALAKFQNTRRHRPHRGPGLGAGLCPGGTTLSGRARWDHRLCKPAHPRHCREPDAGQRRPQAPPVYRGFLPGPDPHRSNRRDPLVRAVPPQPGRPPPADRPVLRCPGPASGTGGCGKRGGP